MVEAVSAQKVLDRVLNIVVEELTRVTEVGGITVSLSSEDGEKLRYAAGHGLPPEFGRGRVLDLKSSPFNRRVMMGETVALGEIAQADSFQFRDELSTAGFKSALLAPLVVGGRSIGVLGAYRRGADQFGEEDMGFFRLAAELVAIAIDDACQAEAISHLMEERTRLMLQVAHNLRAPLSAASTMLETMAGSYLGPVGAAQKEYLDRIGRRLSSMQSTIGEMLALANARRAPPPASDTPVELNEVVTEVTDMFRAEAERKQLNLQLIQPRQVPPLVGSAELLRQLVENLVSNAIKYTPAGGSVRISLDLVSASTMELEVRDTGIGIPKSEQKSLFTEFFRASNARKMQEVGTGLGLPIVKQIAERYAGAVQIRSEEGKGTRVTVTLRLGVETGPESSRPSPSRKQTSVSR
jgi:signal transduction histidine kinase